MSQVRPALLPAQSGTGGVREVVWLAFPVVLSLLSQTLMSAVDVAFLGWFGTVEQGAAGLGAAFFWPFYHACIGCGTGVNIFVAQYIGAQRWADCRVIAWQGIYVSFGVWVLLLVGGLVAPALIRLNAPSPELQAPATLYLQIRLFGSLPVLFNSIFVGFFRGLGNTRTPCIVTIIVEVVNIVLDPLLIFGYAGLPRLGVAGSAIATVSATVVGTCLYLGLFVCYGRRQGLLARLRSPFDSQASWRLIQVSWPVGLQGVLEMGAWTVFTTCIARLGAIETAAHAIATQIMALSYMSGYGVSVAATTLVGQYMGGRNVPAARRSVRSCMVVIITLMGSLGLGFFVCRFPLVGFFTRDAAVVSLGAQLIIFVALFQIFDGLGLIATGVLRGAGDTRWPMLAGLFINWLVFLPLVGVAIFVWQGGIFGGWGAALFYVMVLGVVMLWRMLWGGWHQRVFV